jgi:hypothetical protein
LYADAEYGGDNYSHIPIIQTSEIAQKEGVAIFSLSEQSTVEPRAAEGLTRLSHDTGGQAVVV